MKPSKIRRQITLIAARLIYERQESKFFRARNQAARIVSKTRVRASDLPTNEEIRAEVRSLVAKSTLENPEDAASGSWNQVLADKSPVTDRFRVYRSLLLPLEDVKQSPNTHPEGDALYHSLQVYDLAREHVSYDEEFLLAALLHDVGKAIDSRDHVNSGLQALGETITERTAWFIGHHADAQALRDGILGVRAKRRLQESEDYDELILLEKLDREGRRSGVFVPDVDEALEYIQSLEESFES